MGTEISGTAGCSSGLLYCVPSSKGSATAMSDGRCSQTAVRASHTGAERGTELRDAVAGDAARQKGYQ